MWAGWVLFWKHTMVRKRKYFITLYQYLFPVLYLLLIYFVTKNSLSDEQPAALRRTEPLLYDDLVRQHKRGSVLFTPETAFTNRLMDEVGAKLNISRLDDLPNSEETGYFPFSNDIALRIMNYSKAKMTSDDAIVVFEDLEPDMWPKKLDYTIWMKNNFTNVEYEPAVTDFLWPSGEYHQKDFGMEHDALLRLQWALDSSYIRLLTGSNVDQTLSFEELPAEINILDARYFVVGVVAGLLLPWSILVPFLYLVEALYEGKNSGMHELVKMAGVSWETIAISHVLDVVPVILLFALSGTLFYKLTDFVPRTSGAYIAVALILYCFSMVALAFAVVYIFNLIQYTGLVSTVVFVATWIAALTSISSKIASVILPHAPFLQFWYTVGMEEQLGTGVTNIWNQRLFITVAESYLFMVLQTIFLAMVAWYFSRVQPGKYGQALPWNFLCVKDYWCMQPKTYYRPMASNSQLVHEDDKYFEKNPVGLPEGIKIIDVRKSFGKEAVLHGVDLTMYRGEITVLLGHNGAGKTTLINIITGLLSATSGRVLVEGKDTVMQTKEVRKLIGLCTQENIFFPDFTVLQHVMFFAMVKGKTCSQARAKATDILTRLNLASKADAVVVELSGGMKRRVQLACAVAGGARVLILDEPTSGLDVETRRELWDMLLSLRGDRTVLLTTHFMEEADALGDRIAALHHGRVRCHATAMFLKRAIGTGYRISLTTIGVPLEAEITSAITGVISGATVRDRLPNGISYNLPANDMSRFPALFAALENRRSELRIDTIGVGKSTLDEVFVKLCTDEIITAEELDAVTKEPAREEVTGFMLCARQFAALLLRQWHYVTSTLISLIFIMILMVFLMWLFTEAGNNNPFGKSDKPKKNATVGLNLDLYSAWPERRALVNADRDILEALRTGFTGVDFVATPDVGHAALRAREDDQEYLVGIELNDTNAKALYTITERHAAPAALNALSNALAARMSASAGAQRSMLGEPLKIAASYRPLRGGYVPYDEGQLRQPKNTDKIEIWGTYVVMMSLFYVLSMLRLPSLERAAGTRHALVMAGAPRALVWGATLLAHFVLVSLICTTPLFVCAVAVERDDTLNQPGFLMVLYMLLTLGYLAFLGLVYFITTLVTQGIATALLICFVVVFTSVTPKISMKLVQDLMMVPYVLMPPHALSVGIQLAGKAARINAYCNLNRNKCPTLNGPAGFNRSKCCESPVGSEAWSYWSMGGGGAGVALFILAAQTVGYMVLTLLSDSGALGRLRARLFRVAPPRARFADPSVREEADYVAKAIKIPKKQIPDAILCHDLQKNFPKCCGEPKTFFAVKGLTFSVKKGECFGLLGVNGAGKSTTFSMLTGQASPTGGDIFANGHSVGEGVAYMRTFSYCPQFAGVDDFLTGRQNLALVLTMRGLQASSVRSVTAYWLEEVELTKSADKRVSSYSGGMARRLAAAAALCQAAATAVLDEPTAGVDPVARRRMHVALMRARRNRSLIVASHSMDEMEALCHRIAIMSGGELRALGTTASLKAQFGKGYSVVFKLNTAGDPDGEMQKQFKSTVFSRFACELRDEHRGTLSYYFKESLKYSELFSDLERLREQFPTLLEDYTVTETTLEEVFLILAKEARESPAAPVAPGASRSSTTSRASP